MYGKEVNVLERSRDWMDQAESDLRHAKSDVDAGFYDWACFSAQQAAEKAAKAAFQAMGAEAWGHAVADLLGELGRRQAVPEVLIEAGLELDKAYIPARYPNAHPSGSPQSRYTKTEATRLIGYAEDVVKFCADLLSRLR